MEKELNIGDKVYWAKYRGKTVNKKCPVCFDKREVVVILGNGDNIKTPCNYCDRGFSGPRGYVEEYEFVSDVSEIIIDGKEIEEKADGKSIRYRYGHYIIDDNDICESKREADNRVLELIAEKEKEESRRYEHTKASKLMSLSWSVGYHQKRVRDAEKEIAYHSKKVELVKSIIKKSK